MEYLEPITGLKVGVNTDAIEPEEYFTILKGSVATITENQLDDQLRTVASEIIKARKVGQKRLAEKLEFYAESMIKERILIQKGYRDFIKRGDLENNINKVTPRNGVKLIELDRYPRIIPDQAAASIEAAQNDGIFDDYLVLFTDLTNEKFNTDADRAFVARNKDPICFGYFKQSETARSGDVHVKETFNRLYLVADWVDQYCDITWDKLVTELPEGSFGNLTISEAEVVISSNIKRRKGVSWIARLTSRLKR